MIQLLHQKTQRLGEMLGDVSDALAAYGAGDFDFGQKTEELLEKAQHYYAETQQPDHAAKVSICQADIATLRRGYHPQTFLKIARERRSVQNTQTYRSIQQLVAGLEEEYFKVKSKLDASEELVKQLVLNVLQMRLIDEATLRNRNGQAGLEKIWKTIGEEPNLELFQKKIVLGSSATDAVILLDKVLDQVF